MAAILDTVRPGDVISSDLLNRIIHLLNEHDAMLASGGSGGSTGNQLLTGFSPALEQNVDRVLTAFGNFDFPLGTNSLSIDGQPILPSAFMAGSNNTQLVFRIPTSISVTAGTKKPVTVRITNTKGTDQRSYTLLPQVAGLPDPQITEVRDNVTGSTTLRSQREARIVGLNFASPAANNDIRLVLNPGTQQRNIQLTAKSGSTIQTAPLPSTLLVDMPGFEDADGIAIGDSAPATLSVTVTGANAPAVIGVSIDRME
jgi:hypothetical protein